MKLLIVLSVVLIFLALPVLAFAEEEEQKEEITLTTYYPAPYGDYTDLTVDTLYLNPRNGVPADWDDGAPGDLAYAAGDGKLYYSNNDSAWVAEAGGGGGGGCYVSYSGSCLTGFTNKGSAGGWGNCSAYKTSLWIGANSHFRPAGGGCRDAYGSNPCGWPGGIANPFSSYNVGEAIVCCQ